MSMKHRSRVIKPGFFMSENISQLKPITQLCYIGLWTIADREGRLEHRPKLIDAHLFPHVNANVPKMLQELCEGGFIEFYSDAEYIVIPEFVKHQKIHPHEAKSVLPDPDQFPVDDVKKSIFKMKPKADKVQLEITPWDLANKYNGICLDMPMVKEMPEDSMRYKKSKIRILATQKKTPGKVLKAWTHIFKKAHASDFLSGRIIHKEDDVHRNWKCTFEWIINPTNALKIYDGNFDNQSGLTNREEKDLRQKQADERLRRKSSNEPVSMKSVIDDIRKKGEKIDE